MFSSAAGDEDERVSDHDILVASTIAIGTYKNNNYSVAILLSYNHLMNGGITLTPNLGIRYGCFERRHLPRK
ncbi:Cell surface antigen-like protein Sca8 [Rickettsia akari str. Hartford]|uniref:Cell surface antigen-like protein Sca8 n=2 Tax=Rickettsia akari TaxID=786 RepID=A8GMI2_RICAH|nr:Cell surface antigen-like protein Sca8 [Rickettsia akari str. Hartford]